MKVSIALITAIVIGFIGWNLVTQMPSGKAVLGVASTAGGFAVISQTGTDLWDGNQWFQGPDFGLQDIVAAGVTLVDGIGYAFSLAEPRNSVWPKYNVSLEAFAFDPLTGDSEEIDPPLYTVAFPGVAAVNGRVYKFAGMGATTGYGTVESEYLDTYDLAWYPIRNFPVASYEHTAIAVGGSIYLFGGRLVNGVISNYVFRYNCDSDTYTTLAKLRIPSSYPGVKLYKAMVGRAAIELADGRIALWGGNPRDGSTDIYDPVTNTWSAGPTQAQDGTRCFGLPATSMALGRILSGEPHSVLSIE